MSKDSNTRAARPAQAVPPAGAGAGGLVCPRCGRALQQGQRQYASPRPGRLPRCPEHELAYIHVLDLTAAGGDPLLGRTVAERFTVLARLGVGSMGSIYRARQEAVGRDVALKIMRRAYDPEARARFEREARATSALVSPYTVTVFDFGEAEDDSWFLAMELLSGETLGQRLRRETRLGVEEAVTITRQALRSLAEAHSKGIVHRDLKPDNVFLAKLPAGSQGEGEICKILDFGIAKVQSQEARIDQLETQAGTVFGTPRYMSPEQAQGRELDARSDIYSLGVLLYQMLGGRAPFVDDDAVVVMARHIENPPPRFSELALEPAVPAQIEQVVLLALEKAPEDRFQSADEFSDALDRALAESGVGGTGTHRISWVGPPSSHVRSSRSHLGRRRFVLASATAGAALVVLVLGALLAPRPQEDKAVGQPAGLGEVSVRSGPGTEPGKDASNSRLPLISAFAPAALAAPDGGVDAGVRAAGGFAPRLPPPDRAQQRGRPPSRPAAPDVRLRPDDRYGRFE